MKNQDTAGSVTESCYEWLHTLILAFSVVMLLLTFVFRLVNVDGQSMMDTLFDKDKVIVTNFLYTPKSGDVVVISHGQQLYEPIIKRVIATEGQSLSIDFAKGTVAVDGVTVTLVTEGVSGVNTQAFSRGDVLKTRHACKKWLFSKLTGLKNSVCFSPDAVSNA